MKTTIITAILILSTLGLSATTKNTIIKGQVIESGSNIPMAYATIEILNSDSTLIMEVITDVNGSYFIEDIPAGEYSLKISDLGYEDLSMALEVRGEVLELENIEVNEDRGMFNI